MTVPLSGRTGLTLLHSVMLSYSYSVVSFATIFHGIVNGDDRLFEDVSQDLYSTDRTTGFH